MPGMGPNMLVKTHRWTATPIANVSDVWWYSIYIYMYYIYMYIYILYALSHWSSGLDIKRTTIICESVRQIISWTECVVAWWTQVGMDTNSSLLNCGDITDILQVTGPTLFLRLYQVNTPFTIFRNPETYWKINKILLGAHLYFISLWCFSWVQTVSHPHPQHLLHGWWWRLNLAVFGYRMSI